MITSLKVLLIAISVLASMYLLACALLAFNARSMLYHPAPRSADVPHWTLPRDDADIIVSSNRQHSTQLVLYFGGNTEDVSQALPMLQQAFPEAALRVVQGGHASLEAPLSEALRQAADEFLLKI